VPFYCLRIQFKINIEILAEKTYSGSEFQSIFVTRERLNPALCKPHYHF
jgi:hypothetical protein